MCSVCLLPFLASSLAAWQLLKNCRVLAALTLCTKCCALICLCAGACSERLDSEAIVEFVRALCEVATEELRPVNAPRVYGLAKIVEISHFNMNRIRWACLQSSKRCRRKPFYACVAVLACREYLTKHFCRVTWVRTALAKMTAPFCSQSILSHITCSPAGSATPQHRSHSPRLFNPHTHTHTHICPMCLLCGLLPICNKPCAHAQTSILQP